MSSLERPIPLDEAAGYFWKLKHAGWDEPPDVTGALEGQFTVPLEQALQLVTQVVGEKFKLMIAYYTYAESLRDLAQHSVGEVFHEHAAQELGAAEYYLKRASVLGGAVHLETIDPPPASTDPIHIVQTLMRAEQEAIAVQRQLHQMLGTENPMRIEVERILTEDQHHLDELWQMLPPELHEAGAGAMAPAVPDAAPTAAPQSPQPPSTGSAGEGEGPSPAEAAVPKEAALKMKFAYAMHKIGFGMPVDQYLANEQEGMQAQQQNEAEFFRQQLQQVSQTSAATSQQLSDAQMQLQQLQEQQAQVGTTIQAANDEALGASDEAMRQTQLAANMRLGYQKLRSQIIELASQDPEALGGLPGDVPQGAGASATPGMGVGTPESTGQAVDPGMAAAGDGGPGMPGAAKPSDGSAAQNPTATATTGMPKLGGFGSALMQHLAPASGAVAGGIIGAKSALGKAKELPARGQALEQANQANDGSFAQALEVAKARAGVAESEGAAVHPIRTALVGGLKGAGMGAALGTGVQHLGQNVGNLIGSLGQ